MIEIQGPQSAMIHLFVCTFINMLLVCSRSAIVVHAGEFMLARYREVVDTVLAFRESKERLLRRAVITLIPRLASFAPERFAVAYLKPCTGVDRRHGNVPRI